MTSIAKPLIGEREKFAILGLEADVEEFSHPVMMPNGLETLAGQGFKLPEHWREWLGTTRSEEVDNCGLYVVAKATSNTPQVLDHENHILQNRVWHWYMGLQLSQKLALSRKPFIVSGGWNDHEGVDVRIFQSIEQPGVAVVGAMSPITREMLETAGKLGARLEMLVSAGDVSYWRLMRCLALFRDASNGRDILERIHQFARCVEGLILARRGETTKQFKSRTELFVGPRHHDLMGDIYEMRSDVEHLNENLHLEVFDRDTRIRLAKLEAVIEWVARSSLVRIILDPKLSERFGSTKSLAEFWQLSAVDRQNAWGHTEDPCKMLRMFNFDHVSDHDLGQPS